MLSYVGILLTVNICLAYEDTEKWYKISKQKHVFIEKYSSYEKIRAWIEIAADI